MYTYVSVWCKIYIEPTTYQPQSKLLNYNTKSETPTYYRNKKKTKRKTPKRGTN